MRHFLIYLLAVAIATLTFGGLALADSAIDPSFAATYTTSSSPATAATPAPSPTPVPKPSVSGSPPNVIQGKVMDAGRVWVMGEIRNNGSTPPARQTRSSHSSGLEMPSDIALRGQSTNGWALRARTPASSWDLNSRLLS
jgi:hypothetical protein